jgi:hypothetical protein
MNISPEGPVTGQSVETSFLHHSNYMFTLRSSLDKMQLFVHLGLWIQLELMQAAAGCTSGGVACSFV